MYNVGFGCIHKGEQTMANDFIGKMNTQFSLYNTMSFKTALEYISMLLVTACKYIMCAFTCHHFHFNLIDIF